MCSRYNITIYKAHNVRKKNWIWGAEFIVLYCTVEANYVEVSRGLFATAELLVGLGGEAITTLWKLGIFPM